MNELLPTRNIVAHQPVRRIGKSDGKGLLGKDALETDDLIAHADEVGTLDEELQALARKMPVKSKKL